MASLTLVLGGIKTGKTRFAQARAAEYDKRGEPVIYLATAQAFDSEMMDRIKRHKADRPDHWITVEEPLHVADAYERNSGGKGVVLLDCLTLWLTNIMAHNMHAQAGSDDLPDKDRVWATVTGEIDRLVAALGEGEKDLIIVSNQVEYGLISEYAFARMYQDLSGMAHQYIAARATEVYSMIAGIPLCLKS
jgi:adenosylcobinamide kinase/adenosylcobinamide-phosphate guanylyltransferase